MVKMKTFSLVIPTINRKREVDRLLNSIYNLNYDLDQLEVVIVDQNKENILADIISKYKDKFSITYLRVDFKGAARARNYGFIHAKGKYIHFPDDDSFYHPNTLRSIEEIFSLKNVDVISTKIVDPIKKTKALFDFPDKEQYVNCKNFFKTTIEFNTFFRKEILDKFGLFDEEFGIGSIYPSEESGDLILRLLSEKVKILYTPNIIIFHEDKRNPDIGKVYNYAIGFGALLVKHIKKKNLCIIPYGLSYIGKSLIGIILFFPNKYKRLKYLYRLKGVFYGIKKAKKRI